MNYILIGFGGVATFINFAIIKWKIQKGRYLDVFLDVTVLIAVSYMFIGTMSGLVIGMIASAMMSMYLLVSPPKF